MKLEDIYKSRKAKYIAGFAILKYALIAGYFLYPGNLDEREVPVKESPIETISKSEPIWLEQELVNFRK